MILLILALIVIASAVVACYTPARVVAVPFGLLVAGLALALLSGAIK